MAIDQINLEDVGINNPNLFSGFWQSMPPELLSQLNFILKLGLILLIASIFYIVFMILIKFFSFIFGSSETRKLKKISEQLEDLIKILNKGKNKEKKQKN